MAASESHKLANRKHYLNNKEKYREWGRQWVLRNPARDKAYRKAANLKVRIEALEEYGGTCQCCDEGTLEFLTLDHINNNGATHRKTIKGYNIYRWLKKNGWPSGFQTLCMNCNFAKGKYGGCPHGNSI